VGHTQRGLILGAEGFSATSSFLLPSTITVLKDIPISLTVVLIKKKTKKDKKEKQQQKKRKHVSSLSLLQIA